jgi:hypothetical protein
VTQVKTIGQQLELGIHVFDVRPIIYKGQYRSGHYDFFPSVGWQGTPREHISAIVAAINNFTKNRKELVVLWIWDYGPFHIDTRHIAASDGKRDLEIWQKRTLRSLL